jgi:Ca2+-binding RTX toxin-like protein
LTEGNDVQSYQNANREIFALGGNDRITANGGRDALFGGSGNDVLNARDSGVDTADTLRGGTGEDTLIGDDGDQLLGEGGEDDFIITSDGRAVVTLPDFDPTREDIDFEVQPFRNGSLDDDDYPVTFRAAVGGGTVIDVAGVPMAVLPNVALGTAILTDVRVLPPAAV